MSTTLTLILSLKRNKIKWKWKIKLNWIEIEDAHCWWLLSSLLTEIVNCQSLSHSTTMSLINKQILNKQLFTLCHHSASTSLHSAAIQLVCTLKNVFLTHAIHNPSMCHLFGSPEKTTNERTTSTGTQNYSRRQDRNGDKQNIYYIKKKNHRKRNEDISTAPGVKTHGDLWQPSIARSIFIFIYNSPKDFFVEYPYSHTPAILWQPLWWLFTVSWKFVEGIIFFIFS